MLVSSSEFGARAPNVRFGDVSSLIGPGTNNRIYHEGHEGIEGVA